MSNSEISRRETFRLARFGALLAAGLGVAEQSAGSQVLKGKFDHVMIKGEVGGVLLKLYGIEPNGYQLLKTTEMKGLMMKDLQGRDAAFSIKFWKGATPLVSIRDVMQKV